MNKNNDIEIINISNPNVLNFKILHKDKIIIMYIKHNTTDSIKNDKEIQNILSKHRKKKYLISTCISGTESPEKILEKIIMSEFKRLNC